MRKQTKLVAVLSAASLLAIGASMTSFAATGWVNENGTFYYYDADGEVVTNEWKKDGNAYFYLGDEGEMLTDSWVENEYYVGPNGAMVTNAWVKTMPEDTDDTDPDSDGEAWFYFNNKGKKVSDKEMKINGKYYRFDSDGKMVDGWYEEEGTGKVYYYGDEDDGARKSGWLWLEADTDENGVDEEMADDFDTEAWYYFNSDGSRVQQNKKKINGKWYSFNQYGQMNYGWTLGEKGGWVTDEIGTDSDADLGLGDLLYYFGQENGARVTGFVKVAGPNLTKKQDDTNWYYFKDGKPKYAKDEDAVWVDKEGVASTNNAAEGVKKTIMKEKLEGKYFAFDQNGCMKTGKQPIKSGDNDYDVYYFDDNGYMKTGKVTGIEDGDDTSTYYFSTNNSGQGKGVTGDKDGYLYYKGRRQEADDDYKVVKVTVNNKETYYLVNTKGKIQKSTSKTYDKIENEGIEKIKVKSDGTIDTVNGSAAATFFDNYGGDVAPKAPYFD